MLWQNLVIDEQDEKKSPNVAWIYRKFTAVDGRKLCAVVIGRVDTNRLGYLGKQWGKMGSFSQIKTVQFALQSVVLE